MNAQILRQRYPDADPQQVAWAAQALERLRVAIRRFQTARLHTGELRAGLIPAAVPPAEVSRYLALYRDADLERRTVEDLRSLLHGLLGREPTMDELEAGVPDGEQLGVLPALIGIAAIVGGASVLTNAFEALTAHEERVRTEIVARTPALQESWYSRLWSTVRGPAKTVAIVATVGAAGVLAWEFLGKKYVKGLLPAGKKAAELQKNPEDEDVEDDPGVKEEEEDDDGDSDE